MEGKPTSSTVVAEPLVEAGPADIELTGHRATPKAAVTACVDAVEVVAEAVAQARDTAEEKGIGIAYAYAAQPVWVGTGRDELRQTVDLLLKAAVDSAEAGSVAVRCTPRDGEVLLDVILVPEPGAAGTDLDAVFGGPVQAAPGLDFASLRSMAAAEHGADDGAERVTVKLPAAQA